MTYINRRINGIPYSRYKVKGNLQAPPQWTNEIIRQTQSWPRVREACVLKVTFLLPAAKFPGNFPYGPDLDNLLKRLLDGLKQTVFSRAPGGDSCVVILIAAKTKIEDKKQPGVHIEVFPVSI
jgi:Holliday junction resolvase RusA-like endonuclease